MAHQLELSKFKTSEINSKNSENVIKIGNEEFLIIDELPNIPLQDCFIKYLNHGSGHGESKLHIAKRGDKNYEKFIEDYNLPCFFAREDFTKYIDDTKLTREKYISLFLKKDNKLKNKIKTAISYVKNSNDERFYFEIKLWENNSLKAGEAPKKFSKMIGSSIYVTPKYHNEKFFKEYDYFWDLLRTIAITDVTHLKIFKVFNLSSRRKELFFHLYFDLDMNQSLKKERRKGHRSVKKIRYKIKKTKRDSSEQARWKKSIIELNGSICIMSGITDVSLIKAAHIKPYNKCLKDNEDPYDIYNGFPMTGVYHDAFERGLFTFDENSDLMVSRMCDDATKKELGLNKLLKFYKKFITKDHQKWLDYHRKNIFKQ